MTETGNSAQLFSISELAEQTGVSRRTIHFYVKEGLLPPPQGRGPNARYSEEHVLKLVLIGLLKESVPLRLEGIRELITPMGPRALRNEIRKLGGRGPIRSDGPDAEMIRATLFSANDADTLGFDEAPPGREQGLPLHFLDPAKRRLIAERATPSRVRSESDAMTKGSRDFQLEDEIWFRARVSDGVEIHYSAGTAAGKIRRLVALARQIFRR